MSKAESVSTRPHFHAPARFCLRAGAGPDPVVGGGCARRIPSAHGGTAASTEDGARPTNAARAGPCRGRPRRPGASPSATVAAALSGSDHLRKSSDRGSVRPAQTAFRTLDTAAFASASPRASAQGCRSTAGLDGGAPSRLPAPRPSSAPQRPSLIVVERYDHGFGRGARGPSRSESAARTRQV